MQEFGTPNVERGEFESKTCSSIITITHRPKHVCADNRSCIDLFGDEAVRGEPDISPSLQTKCIRHEISEGCIT